MAAPLTPCPVCWFLMFICCAISYWKPCEPGMYIWSDVTRTDYMEQNTHIWKQQVHFLYNFEHWLYWPQIFSNVPIFLEGRVPWAPILKFLAWTLQVNGIFRWIIILFLDNNNNHLISLQLCGPGQTQTSLYMCCLLFNSLSAKQNL